MVVRGAPAIGVTAAYAIVLAAVQSQHVSGSSGWLDDIKQAASKLNEARPTAVNLFWATAKMVEHAEALLGVDDSNGKLEQVAVAIHTQDIELNKKMAALGANYITNGATVMTHCNTGALATGGMGTALGVIRYAYRSEKINHVFACETRPWLQGARLTAYELAKEKIPHTLIIDSAAALIMRDKKPEWVIVGADRISADGSAANKIGTYSLAVAAKHHGVKFMVVAPHTTVDMHTKSGADIAIEERSSNEITSFHGNKITHENTCAMNPAFDVTPPELIDVIVTDIGVVENPTSMAMSGLFTNIKVVN